MLETIKEKEEIDYAVLPLQLHRFAVQEYAYKLVDCALSCEDGVDNKDLRDMFSKCHKDSTAVLGSLLLLYLTVVSKPAVWLNTGMRKW